MNNKKILSVIFCMIAILSLCAFSIVPHLNLSSSSGSVDVLYLDATTNATNDVLTINMNYVNNNMPFEVVRDVTVRAGSATGQKLDLISNTAEYGKYAYTFDYKGVVADTVYIEPPVLYTPIDIGKVSMDLIKNTSVKAADNQEWFEINDIIVEYKDDETIAIAVFITPKNDTMPRFPILELGNDVYEGTTIMYMDEAGEFYKGEFIFHVPATEVDAISVNSVAKSKMVATISIEHAMERIDAKEVKTTSAVKSLNVHTVK